MISSPFPRRIAWWRPQGQADWWFEALDGSKVRSRAEPWRAQVLGIHKDGDDLWIQVAHAGAPEHSIVLHVTPSVTLDDVARTLRARPGDLSRRHIIHVAHAA